MTEDELIVVGDELPDIADPEWEETRQRLEGAVHAAIQACMDHGQMQGASLPFTDHQGRRILVVFGTDKAVLMTLADVLGQAGGGPPPH